jgi:hypothetical protein
MPDASEAISKAVQARQGARLKASAQSMLVLAFASALLISSVPLALVAGILCHEAARAATQGDLADAMAKLRWGRIVTAVSYAVGVAVAVVFVALR